MAHEFEIPVSELDAGGKDYSFVLRPTWIQTALVDTEAKNIGKEGSLQVRVSKSLGDIAVHGRLKAELEAPCGRCLEPAHVSIDQRLAVMYVPKAILAHGDKGERELTPEEADVLAYEGETLVLDDLVRDELVLEIPMIPLCSADCQGIAPPPPHEESSAAPAVDPRLAPLLKLKAVAIAGPNKKNKE